MKSKFINEPPRKKQRKHIQQTNNNMNHTMDNQKNKNNVSIKINKSKSSNSSKKRMNRQLTFPIHSNSNFDHQIKRKKPRKNEYVHIETLYHYSKPVV